MTIFYLKIFALSVILSDNFKYILHLKFYAFSTHFSKFNNKKPPELSFRRLYTCARRFELPTPWSVAKCSIQLSYAHILNLSWSPRMPATGIEPVLYCYNRILSPARLPVPPRRHVILSGTNRARTYDPLLVRQMLSQLSYDPIFNITSDPSGTRTRDLRRDRAAL